MELFSEAFGEAVTAAMDSGHPVLCTIPVHRIGFVDRLRQRRDVTLIEATAANRDELPDRLIEMLA